ncbi:MAG: NBR1-Ig-like domain-containing protein [Anaerolineae bacterium]
MNKRRVVWLVVLSLMGLALACNMPGRTPTPEPVAEDTPVAPAAPIVTATMTLQPVAALPSSTPTEAPDVAGEGGCVLRAAYVADVTIPDNTKLEKNQAFIKTWRIRNSGTCTWGEGTKFVYVSGDILGAPPSVAVPPTAPNAQVDISVSMTAPAAPGTYRSNWQLQDPSGKAYGGIFYVQIVIEGPATPTPTVAPAAPGNFVGTVSTDCKTITFTWTTATGQTAYRIEGPGLLVNLPADATTYVWNNPPAGASVVTLIAVGQSGAEIGRVSVTVNVACGVSGVDLYVESLTFEPATPVAHLPLKVLLRVRNRGVVDSGSFVARWWGGKNFTSASCEWNVTGVTAGATVILGCDNFRYSSSYGSLVTKAQVDVENTVTESDETNNVFENTIAVVNPRVVYDFVEKAPLASWESGDPVTDLTWNGGTGDAQGFVRWDTGNLETGTAIQGKCLETHPKWVANGWVAGAYTDLYTTEHYVVQVGDRFYATVGLLQGANAGNVTFKVLLRAASSGTVTLAQVSDIYGDGMKTISVDLSPYAGQGADIILRVDAGDSANQDWACWSRAEIYRYP